MIGNHILPFLESGDVPGVIVLTDIHVMYVADGHVDDDVTRSKTDSNFLASEKLPAHPATSNTGEKVSELSVSDRIEDLVHTRS